MAQYDGSIRINTKIRVKEAEVQLTTLENRMRKTADKIASLRSEMDALKNEKTPTKEYAKLQSQLDATIKKFDELDEQVKDFQKMGTDKDFLPFKQARAEAQDLYMKIEDIRGAMFSLEELGKAFTLGSGSEEYAKIGRQLQYAESEMSVLNQKHDIQEMKLKKAGKEYRNLAGKAKSAFNSIGNVLKKTNATVGAFGRKIKEVAQKHIPFFRKETEKAKTSASGFAGRLKSLALSLLIFNQVGKAFRALSSSISAGFTNMYNDDVRFKASIDSLRASVLTLQNAFAAAFRPIADVAVPYIQKLVEWLTVAVNLVGQFFAALAGRKTYTRAIKQTAKASEEAAEATEEETEAMQKQLSPLDDLNNLTSESNKGKDKGKGDKETGAGIMFEEVPIDSGILDIAKWIKDMWDKADFYDLGKTLGEKLKEALDSIPWDYIKEWARKLAHMLATLINGFIEVEGLGYSIGRTLAQAINTAYEFLNEFVHTLHWEFVGHFIADTLNGFFENIDWALIRDTFVTGFKGLADAINQFITDFHWDNVSDSITNAINIIAETVYTFFSTVDWDELGRNLGEQLRKTIEKIDWEMIGRAIGSVLQSAFDFLKSFLKQQDFRSVVDAISDLLKGFFEEVDTGDLATVITMVIGMAIAKISFKALLGYFAAGLSGALASMGGIGGLLTTDIATIFGAGTFAEIGLTAGTALLGAFAGVFAGGVIGKLLNNYVLAPLFSFDEELSAQYKNFKFFGEDGFFATLKASITDGSWKEALHLWGEDIKWAWTEIWGYVKEDFSNSILGEILGSFTDGTWREALSLWGDDIYNAFVTLGERQEEWLKSLKEKWSSTWSDIKGKIDDKIGSIKSTVGSAIDWLKSKLDALKSSFNIWTGGAGGIRTSNARGGGASRMASPYAGTPAIAALADMPIPGYATGQVIPRSMKQHLAILGDNTRETEVVSPLSTIEQAVINAMTKVGGLGGGNGQEINLNLTVECEGYQLLHILQKLDAEFFKQNGRHAFA